MMLMIVLPASPDLLTSCGKLIRHDRICPDDVCASLSIGEINLIFPLIQRWVAKQNCKKKKLIGPDQTRVPWARYYQIKPGESKKTLGGDEAGISQFDSKFNCWAVIFVKNCLSRTSPLFRCRGLWRAWQSGEDLVCGFDIRISGEEMQEKQKWNMQEYNQRKKPKKKGKSKHLNYAEFQTKKIRKHFSSSQNKERQQELEELTRSVKKTRLPRDDKTQNWTVQDEDDAGTCWNLEDIREIGKVPEGLYKVYDQVNHGGGHHKLSDWATNQ